MSGITDRLYEALKAVEWGGIEMACPDCCWDKSERGHSPDCNLAAALAEWEDNEAHWALFWEALTGKVEKKI